MIYNSTRDKNVTSDGLQAVLEGIAPDGGLYIPSDLNDGRFDWQECLQKDFTAACPDLVKILLACLQSGHKKFKNA